MRFHRWHFLSSYRKLWVLLYCWCPMMLYNFAISSKCFCRQRYFADAQCQTNSSCHQRYCTTVQIQKKLWRLKHYSIAHGLRYICEISSSVEFCSFKRTFLTFAILFILVFSNVFTCFQWFRHPENSSNSSKTYWWGQQMRDHRPFQVYSFVQVNTSIAVGN